MQLIEEGQCEPKAKTPCLQQAGQAEHSNKEGVQSRRGCEERRLMGQKWKW